MQTGGGVGRAARYDGGWGCLRSSLGRGVGEVGCRPHFDGCAGVGGWRLIGCLPDLRDELFAGLLWGNGGIRRGLLDGMHDARVRAEEAGGSGRRWRGARGGCFLLAMRVHFAHVAC